MWIGGDVGRCGKGWGGRVVGCMGVEKEGCCGRDRCGVVLGGWPIVMVEEACEGGGGVLMRELLAGGMEGVMGKRGEGV